MDLKAGARLSSVVDTTEVIVVQAPSELVDLRCGGVAMVPLGTAPPEPAATNSTDGDGHGDGTMLGKRYVDEDSGLEVLCTKAGSATLGLGDRVLTHKGAKPLPSSD